LSFAFPAMKEGSEVFERIDMVAIYVRDWPALLGWYQEKLGFATVYVEDDHRFAVLALSGGGPVLHLVGDETREPGGRNRCIPNLVADDFDTTLVELCERGGDPLKVARCRGLR